MKWYASIPATLMLLAAIGCGAVRGGNTIVKYEEGVAPITTEIRSSGTYQLFSLTDYTPKVTVRLTEGQKVGFRSSQTGEVVAVAGNREFPLSANDTYYWKRSD